MMYDDVYNLVEIPSVRCSHDAQSRLDFCNGGISLLYPYIIL